MDYQDCMEAFKNWHKNDHYAKGYSPEEYRFSDDATGGFFDDRAVSFYAGYMAAINKEAK